MNKQLDNRIRKEICSIIGSLAIIFTTFLIGTGFTLSKTNSPIIRYVKWSSPINNDEKGTDLKGEIYHHTTFINAGDEPANDLEIVEIIPENTDFKLDSIEANIEFTGLSVAIEYSSDFDPAIPAKADWKYKPVSQNGGADVGYDRLVKAIRLRVVDGTLSNLSPNNTGSIGFVTKNY